MFRTIYWYTYFAISLVFTLPCLHKAKSLLKEGKTEEAEAYILKITARWAGKQIKNSGGTIHIHGKENIPTDRSAVFISNHQGNFDVAIFMSLVPSFKGYISKLEVKKIPIVRDWMTLLHCIFMDRDSLKSAATAIVEGVKTVKGGHSLVIFPEGTRSKGDQMGEFKAGSFKLATKSGAPIIPVTMNGSYKLMEANGGKVTPATVHVYIHPPVETAGLTKDEQAELPQKIQSIIATKLPHQH